MKNSLVLHGHFYQPPREDPWTGLVPKQESAAPFHDWNRRIAKECYGANAASRMLDPQGRIIDIINNYRYLSFNIGPTLLDWLYGFARNVYEKILEADAESVGKYHGHGNAIAQSYNHTILPLDTPEDKRTQIKWGLANFKRHFGRYSEGLWLPEAGVDDETLDVLIDEGVSYIILSPWQAAAYTTEGQKTWKPLDDAPVPSNRAYKIERRNGSIAVFFYNNFLAQGISFNHFLRNAENLYRTLMNYHDPKNGANLISAATDGEIYGHHEPFGDMCLAALIPLVEHSKTLKFSNFGLYLKEHPPKDLVKLKEGEDGLGTSWSCFHGVSRWRKDCGCSTGAAEGWNQKWRTPLRSAFAALRDVCMDLYVKELENLGVTEDPLRLRNDYIRTLTGVTSPDAFAAAYLPGGASGRMKTRFLSLLEGQKYGMYMFTSCGWFFADISGLEPLQNMRYALKAIEYYQPLTSHNLLEILLTHLSGAESNMPDRGTGGDIFQRLILPDKKDLSYPAAVFTVTACLGNGFLKEMFGAFRQKDLSLSPANSTAGCVDYSGSLTVENTAILASESFVFELKEAREGFDLNLTPKSAEVSKAKRTPIDELPDTIIEACVHSFSEPVRRRSAAIGEDMLGDIVKNLSFAKKLKVNPNFLVIKAAELSVNSLLKELLQDPVNLVDRNVIAKLRNLLTLARNHRLSIDEEAVRKSLTRSLTLLMDVVAKDIASVRVDDILRLLGAVRDGGIEPDITISQNILFPMLHNRAEEYRKGMEAETADALLKLKHLIKLGDAMGFNVEGLKNVLLG